MCIINNVGLKYEEVFSDNKEFISALYIGYGSYFNFCAASGYANPESDYSEFWIFAFSSFDKLFQQKNFNY